MYGERQPRVPALDHLFNYVGNFLDRALPIVWCPVHMPFLLPPKLDTQGHEFQWIGDRITLLEVPEGLKRVEGKLGEEELKR